jgi:hypothetical protein
VVLRRAALVSAASNSSLTRSHPTDPPLYLLGRADRAHPPTTQLVRPEGWLCLTTARLSFWDPGWGEIAFDLSVWRKAGNDMPEYEVIIE